MKKLELEGYLYLTKNEYDQYEVDEICFNEDISKVFFKNLDWYSYKNSEWKHYGGYKVPDGVKIKEIEDPVYLADILKEKLGLESKGVKMNTPAIPDNIGEYTFTFKPRAKRVRIVIEEVE